MSDLKVNIVKLESMRVVSFHAVSNNPEVDGWTKMNKWSKSKELLKDLENHPLYGFNNPDPSPDKKEYGYEYWIKVGSDFESDEVEVKDFPGGLFAVTKCNPNEDMKNEFFKENGFLITWKKLREWVENSKYSYTKRPCFEHHLDPLINPNEWLFDLYFPIKEA